ncbi:sugar kinase [Salinibacterium sp. G-O1]|uniref:sugar kinase n=1 Tax=Salinibacterium sp. G-O1 TaxID=3046208 RepID=UPI0024B9A61B|nr:sugar kinase [Salinibacterium sp. G-O1]MDJ0333853.1 sugar kinase [Salinibacterium sp. G-O1]
MTFLKLRPVAECEFDAVSLGEVMLRLDPGEGRIRTARSFTVWEGGGEYNVSRALSRTFGLRTSVATSLVDNEVGRLVESLILSGGVDTSLILWRPFDGIGRAARNALNFTERGFGIRGAIGVSDRGHSAASLLAPAEIDWNHLFGTRGVRWFHVGGVFAGLSDSALETTLAAATAARANGTAVSVDLNFRPSLWSGADGAQRSREVFTRLAEVADVLVGGATDFVVRLGVSAKATDDGQSIPVSELAAEVLDKFPQLSLVAATQRVVHSASVNDWSVVARTRGGGALASTRYDNLNIMDRVGGGDGFLAGLVYGLLDGRSASESLEIGAAHGALAMTTPGDNSMASLREVLTLVDGGSAHVSR